MTNEELVYIEDWLHAFFDRYIKEAIRDTAGKEYDITISDGDGNNVLQAGVLYQYFYNPLTNKVFVEFTFNTDYVAQFDEAKTSDKIIRYIKANIRKDAMPGQPRIWPEIVMLEDGVNERCDTSQILTPFAIGWWKSLGGNYNFLTDQIEIAEVWKALIPEFPDGFSDDLQDLYDQYYVSDFAEFSKRLYDLLVQYKVSYDAGPTKDVRVFFAQVEELNSRYRNPKLNPTDWDAYNTSYTALVMLYKDDPDAFKVKLEELNDSYGITLGWNSKVPEMFEEYRVLFNAFFGETEFPVTEGHVRRYEIKVNKVV